MMYPFMQLDDNTEIVHSELQQDENGEFVKVYIEKPVEGGFYSGICYLPSYRWEEINGFDKNEIEKYQELLESTAHLIIRFARQGGIGNASNF